MSFGVVSKFLEIGETHHHGPFAPAPVPVAAYVADPISLAPNTWTDIDSRVELHTHLEISLEDRFWDREGSGGGGVPLKSARCHALIVSFLADDMGLAMRCWCGPGGT